MFKGRFPIAFLFLSMPPEKLDVNIHPTKKEIRFDDNSEVEDFVADAIAAALKGEQAVPDVSAEVASRQEEPVEITQIAANHRAASLGERPFRYETPALKQQEQGEQERIDVKTVLGSMRESQTAEIRRKETPDPVPEKVNRPFEFEDLTVIGAVFNTYILAQDEDCFYMIDQHAAHERVFYEKLMRQYEAEEKVSQQMLVPLSFSVASEVAESESSWIGQVRAMGYDIEFFGNNTYIVREIPAFMEMSEAEAFLGDLFGSFRDKPDLTDHRILDKIITRSCKSAVKGGDTLDAAEVDALMTQLSVCDNPFSCPHGRPTFIKMTRYELERMFKRA